jgi:hypothetical protein
VKKTGALRVIGRGGLPGRHGGDLVEPEGSARAARVRRRQGRHGQHRRGRFCARLGDDQQLRDDLHLRRHAGRHASLDRAVLHHRDRLGPTGRPVLAQPDQLGLWRAGHAQPVLLGSGCNGAGYNMTVSTFNASGTLADEYFMIAKLG